MILPVGFSLLLRRWLATLLFGVLALCGGLLMSGASAEAEPTSSIQRVASYDRGSTTTPTGNTRIVAVGADRELTEAPRPYASRIALGRATKAGRPAVSDTRLGRAVGDDYRGGPNPVGDGSALDAARHTVRTGDLVGGSTHLEKAVEMRDRYSRILRRGGLDPTDEAVARGRFDAYRDFAREHRLDEMMRARGLR
jgi:hypothetical protein